MWQEARVPTDDLDLAVFSTGGGPPVLLINGGPGDDHRYLRPVAEPLADAFHCLLYDQRGCGQSRLGRLDGATLHIDRFVADIEAIRRHFGFDRLGVVGHSWGGILALAFAAHRPASVACQVLVGMGPLDAKMGAVATANLRQGLTAEAHAALDALKRRRREAVAAGDLGTQARLHIRQMRDFSARRWFYHAETAARFAEYFADLYNFNPLITPHLWPTVMALDLGSRAEGLPVPTLVVYGYQDFEPITQAYDLRARMPQVEIRLINECGHVPWLEQPDEFYEAVRGFLTRHAAA